MTHKELNDFANNELEELDETIKILKKQRRNETINTTEDWKREDFQVCKNRKKHSVEIFLNLNIDIDEYCEAIETLPDCFDILQNTMIEVDPLCMVQLYLEQAREYTTNKQRKKETT